MNRPTQPETEIRDALDREVRRVFDPARLAAALEERRLHESAPREAGPLSRVPPVVQWIGVVAAVIAALTGLRSLVLDLTAPGEAPAIVERAAADPVPRVDPLESSAAHEVEPPRELPSVEPAVPRTSRAQGEQPPAAAQSERAALPEPREASAKPDVAAARRAPTSRAPEQTQAQARPFATPPELARPEAHAPTTSARAPAAQSTTATGPIVQATFPRLAEQNLRGFRVTSLRLGEQELTGELVDLPEIDATLVAIRGRAAPRVTRSRRPFTPPAAAVENGLQDGPLYVRVLVGVSEGNLSSTPHVVLDKDADLVPVEELGWVAEPWPDQERVLERRFELSSIVALDAFRISAGEDSRRFVALAGDRRYEMRVTRDRPGHGIGLVISPREGSESIRATISIENDRLAILAVPESMLPGRGARQRGETLFVTLSAPSPETFERVTASERAFIVVDPEHAPILLSEIGRRYEVANDGRGDVRLLALVGKDGEVSAIKVLEHPPDDDGEQLALAAAATVRGWRYLPARHRGLEVATWVEVALSSP
jgi:outer membrane biosynthesis protein TonB